MFLTNPKQDPARSAGIRAVPNGRRRVLIVDDSNDIREMLQLLFEMNGFDVFATGDGLSALQLASQYVPDIVLLDLQLPTMDGLSVVREMRQHSRLSRTIVVIVSGHDPARYRQAAIAAGCNEYLLKPVDFDQLTEIVDKLDCKVAAAAG